MNIEVHKAAKEKNKKTGGRVSRGLYSKTTVPPAASRAAFSFSASSLETLARISWGRDSTNFLAWLSREGQKCVQIFCDVFMPSIEQHERELTILQNISMGETQWRLLLTLNYTQNKTRNLQNRVGWEIKQQISAKCLSQVIKVKIQTVSLL